MRAIRIKVEREEDTQDADLLTVLAIVTEPLAHCASGEWREVLERCSLGSDSGNNDRIYHRIVLLQGLDKLRNSRALLSFSVLTLVPTALVKDGVDSNGGLASLTVTDDKLTFTTADGYHGIDGLNASHH